GIGEGRRRVHPLEDGDRRAQYVAQEAGTRARPAGGCCRGHRRLQAPRRRQEHQSHAQGRYSPQEQERPGPVPGEGAPAGPHGPPGGSCSKMYPLFPSHMERCMRGGRALCRGGDLPLQRSSVGTTASMMPMTRDASRAPMMDTSMDGTMNWVSRMTTAAVRKPMMPRFWGETLWPMRASTM